MPRIARLNRPGAFYHVISCFIDDTWFLQDDEERSTYLRMFAHALRATDWVCFAYALMSNHLHFAMLAGELPMSSWTISVNGSFGQWMNARHGRRGHVFADRPTDFEISSARQGHAIAYIHNNPVRAGVVSRASESTWTSHRAYAGLTRPARWLDVANGLKRSGFDDGREFDDWVAAKSGELDRVQMNEIHRELRRRGGLELATPTDAGVPVIARPFAHVRPDPLAIVKAVVRSSGVSELALCSRRRVADAVAARRLLVHCAKRIGYCGSDIAALLGISEQAVSKLGLAPLDDVGSALRDRVLRQLEAEVSLVEGVPSSGRIRSVT